jgi:hypothetical protein
MPANFLVRHATSALLVLKLNIFEITVLVVSRDLRAPYLLAVM